MIARTAAAVLAAFALAPGADAAAPPRDSPALRSFASDLDECARALAAVDKRLERRERIERCLPTLVSYKALEKPGKGLTGALLADASIMPLKEADLGAGPGVLGRTLAMFALMERKLGAGALRPADAGVFTQTYDVPTAWVQSWKFARAQARARRENAGVWRELAPGKDAAELEAFLAEFLPSRLEAL